MRPPHKAPLPFFAPATPGLPEPPNGHGTHMLTPGGMPLAGPFPAPRPLAASDVADGRSAREQLEAQMREIYRLQGTLVHYRNWAAQLQTRYQLFNPDSARPAKRVYIGNLPANIGEGELRQAVNELMVQIGATVLPGFPITSIKLYPGAGDWPGAVPPPQVQDKSYAFVEFRSVEEASNAMALDGVLFRDNYIKIRRPNNYDAGQAIMLGPTDPSPALDLAGLEIVRTVVADSPHKLFVGGLPCDWTEDQVKDMLMPFGPLKAFNLVMDRATGNSKGYAFCEYTDVSVTDVVISQLNGKAIGNKFLTVKRALAPAAHPVGHLGAPVQQNHVMQHHAVHLPHVSSAPHAMHIMVNHQALF